MMFRLFPPEVSPATRGYIARAAMGSLLLEIPIVASVWPERWMVAAVVGTFVLRSIWNSTLTSPSRPTWLHGGHIDELRSLVNAGFTVVVGVVTAWTLPVLLYGAFSMLVLDGFAQRESRLRAVRHGLILFAGALLSGVPLAELAFITVFTTVIYSAGYGRSRMLREVVTELETTNERLTATTLRLEQMQRRLVEQEKLWSLGVLAGGIAHEINNPMSWVTANTRAVLDDLQAEPSLSPTLQEHRDDTLPSTLAGIHRVNAIVADLRRFARRERAEMAPLDLREEIHAAARLAHGELLKHSCTLELQLEELPPVHGSAQQLAQVLLNLIINGAQGCSVGGTVRVTAEREGAEVVTRVIDDGIGISPENLGRIFEPFFTTKRPGEGTGLGLSVAHGIVTAHGGSIGVESTPGVGTCFTVRLPAAEQMSEPASAARA